MRYLWGAEGGIVFLSRAHGPEAGESEGTDWSKEAFEGSAQLQDGGGTETGPTTAFEEVTRPIQMLRRLRALFLAAGVGMFKGSNVGMCGCQTKRLTWTFATNFRQPPASISAKAAPPSIAQCQMSWVVFRLALNVDGVGELL